MLSDIYTISFRLIMRKSRKRSNSEPQVGQPSRKSSRSAKPSQRLVESEVLHVNQSQKSKSHEKEKQHDGELPEITMSTDETLKLLQIQMAEMKAQLEEYKSGNDCQNSQEDESLLEEEVVSFPKKSQDPEPFSKRIQGPEPKRSTKHVIEETFHDSDPSEFNNHPSTSAMPSQNTAQSILTSALQQMFVPEEEDQGEQLFSTYLQLGATLDLKTKTKIWSKQYVDLSQLTTKDDPSVSVSIQNNGQPSISLKPNKSAPPQNFNAWLQLFSTYAAVYLEKYPSEGPSIMTYIIRILDLSRKYQGYGWRSYDEKFRKIRVQVSVPWHVVRTELLLECFALSTMYSNQIQNKMPKKQPFRGEKQFRSGSQFQEGNYRSPRGVCFTYDKFGKCTNPYKPCKYEHKCTVCDKSGHHRSICRQNATSTVVQETSPPRKP